MEYCIVNVDGVITNIIIADELFAESIGALPSYGGAMIGCSYSPPEPIPTPTIEDLAAENKLLKAQLQAQSDRSDFIEDCIAEMATVVYGGV